MSWVRVGWGLLHPNPYPYLYAPVASTHMGLQTHDIPYSLHILVPIGAQNCLKIVEILYSATLDSSYKKSWHSYQGMSPRVVNPKIRFWCVLFISESGSANLFANGCKYQHCTCFDTVWVSIIGSGWGWFIIVGWCRRGRGWLNNILEV